MVKAGSVPEVCSKAKRAQMDTDCHCTLKRGCRRPQKPRPRALRTELVIQVFGDKNQVGIERCTASSAASWSPTPMRTTGAR
jgi:hypothetical protein